MTIYFNEIFKVLFPILLSFMTGRIILQTDLIMLAPLGEVATAAFGVPSRIMLIDIIAAFAIAPVVSVMVATAKTEHEKKIAIQGSLSFSAYLSVALTLAGLIFYPAIINAVVKNNAVAEMASGAVLWLTLAIPARLLQFVGAMILFGSNRGRHLIPIFGISIFLNGVLNWLLIYRLEMGFLGSYVATFIISHLEVVWMFWLLRKDTSLRTIIQFPKFAWVSSFIKNIGAELARLISWQLLWFVILMLLSSNAHWVSRLSAYSVAMEFYFFLMMPLMAFMRCTAIFLGPHAELNGHQLYVSAKRLALLGMLVTALVSVGILIGGKYIGEMIYHLNSEAMDWWKPFIFITSVMLPLYYLNSIQRGIWQSKKQFRFLFLLEASASWGIFLPAAYVGFNTSNPWLVWGGMAIMEIVVACILFYARDKLSTESLKELKFC